jgi:apolipoprotein N-acyltransferase
MGLRMGISLRLGASALGAGALGAAAFPPLGLWPLVLVSIALFLLLLGRRPAAEARQLGIVYGLGYGLGTMYWLFGMFGAVAIGFVALMAGYFGILATLIGLVRDRPAWARAALVALFAVAIDWLRGDAWYLRFPWYTAPHALAASPRWIAPVAWIGTYGLTYVVWLIAAAGAFIHIRYWLAFLLLPLCSLLLPPVGDADRTALLVQAEDPAMVRALLRSARPDHCDLTVLPEYAFPDGIETALTSPEGPAQFARKHSCPLVFGTVEGGAYGQPGFQNVAAVLDAEGNLIGTFPKQRPVPLMLDGRPGTRRPIFSLGNATLGVALCYDFDAPAIAGSLAAAGATVLVAPTGDLMTWGRIQHVHHELIHRLRAVETDRWLLRDTSSGRTEVIDPHGVPSGEHLEIGDSGCLIVRFADRSSLALGARLYLLGPSAGGLTALVALLYGVRKVSLRIGRNGGAREQYRQPLKLDL